MKIAILILAHKNFKQLIKLIDRLQHPCIDIYIHLDLKWKLNREEIIQLRKKSFLIDDRISCSLDDSSLVEVEEMLLREAYRNKYDYYCLISAQDYPIVSTDFLVQNLQKNYPNSYIDITPSSFGNWVWFKYTASQWFKQKNNMLNIKKNKLTKLNKLIYLFYDILCVQNCRTLNRKLKKMNIKTYGGSQWWILSDKEVEKILQYINNNPSTCSEIKKSFTPDETFFQTVLMQTEAARNVKVNKVNATDRNCATYIDFGGYDKPVVAHPYVLTINDVDKIQIARKNNYLFARKFDETIDNDIFEWIDRDC